MLGRDDRIQLLHWAVIGGLYLSALAPSGLIPSFFRAVAAVLAGRAITLALIRGDETAPRPSGTTVLYIAVVWLATLSPVVLIGRPDAARTSAVAAAFVLLLAPRPVAFRMTLAVVLVLSAVALAGISPHAGALGQLEFAMGATWPRNWGDAASVAGFFLLGSVWEKTG